MEGPPSVQDALIKLFAEFIPDADFEFLRHENPWFLYKHRITGWPLAAVPGTGGGQLIGVVIYFRAPDNTCNLQMECLFNEMGAAASGFVGTYYKEQVKDGTASADSAWEKFMGNIKRAASADAEAAPESPTKKQAAESAPAQPEQTQLCMICLTLPADTMVFPCYHIVVCASCSPQLSATNDASICCQCRCAITTVHYPDGTEVKIEK